MSWCVNDSCAFNAAASLTKSLKRWTNRLVGMTMKVANGLMRYGFVFLTVRTTMSFRQRHALDDLDAHDTPVPAAEAEKVAASLRVQSAC